MIKKTEFNTLFFKLVAAFPKYYQTEAAQDLWFERFSGKDLKLFEKVIDRLIDGDTFPSMSQATGLYKAIQQGESCRSSQQVHHIPDRILNMTPEQIEKDYKLTSDFIKAYPFPDIPEGANIAESQKIEDDYYRRMRRAGIDPNEATNPEVGRRLMHDLLNQLPETMTGRKSKDDWKKTLEVYNRNRDAKDFETAKKAVMSSIW